MERLNTYSGLIDQRMKSLSNNLLKAAAELLEKALQNSPRTSIVHPRLLWISRIKARHTPCPSLMLYLK